MKDPIPFALMVKMDRSTRTQTDNISGMRRIAQLPTCYLWILLLVLFLVPLVALAQSPGQKAAFSEAKQLHEEAAALFRAGN
ncbi:MAG: hypothetical protein V3U06_11480, partial [Candidatus Binatia bacterium]